MESNSSEDAIWVTVRDEETLSEAEVKVLIEACRTYWNILEMQGDSSQQKILVSASKKIGIYTED